ncbi:hypothetical protein niasHT_032375 [Heterodera trifolii]
MTSLDSTTTSAENTNRNSKFQSVRSFSLPLLFPFSSSSLALPILFPSSSSTSSFGYFPPMLLPLLITSALCPPLLPSSSPSASQCNLFFKQFICC